MNIYNLKNCDGRHLICIEQTIFLSKNLNNSEIFTKETFNKYLDTITYPYSYNSCISNYSNKNNDLILKFIELVSKTIEILPIKLLYISTLLSDYILEIIIKNQLILDKTYIKKLLHNQTVKNNYGLTVNIISNCIVNKKNITLKSIISQLDIIDFIEVINIKENFSIEAEKIISEYIIINKEKFTDPKFLNNIISSITSKSKIIKELYSIISDKIDKVSKKNILDKCVSSLDKQLILTILEGNDVIPDNITCTNMLKNVYFRNSGATNSKLIAEIIDIFIIYQFKITTDIIIELLKHGCYINSIEKYVIPIDNLILEECSELSYYPYDFNCIPSLKIMLKECQKYTNLEKIKMFKEKGGILNTDCLEKACEIKKNGKVLKYLINDCGIKPTYECLQKFQDTYGIEALDIIMINYTNEKSEIKKINNNIILDNESTMTIVKKDIEINHKTEYLLKNKIKKLFKYNKKNILYQNLVELMLKYIINNKLIIGNYFIINKELSLLLKINQCTIINIDQLDNILSYFIY